MQPAAGPSSGGDLVRLVGTGFANHVRVLFGDAPAIVVSVRDESELRIVDVRTPPNQVGVVDVELTNLDADGVPVPGESIVVAGAYRFARPMVAREADPVSSISTHRPVPAVGLRAQEEAVARDPASVDAGMLDPRTRDALGRAEHAPRQQLPDVGKSS